VKGLASKIVRDSRHSIGSASFKAFLARNEVTAWLFSRCFNQKKWVPMALQKFRWKCVGQVGSGAIKKSWFKAKTKFQNFP
jgi:hypothetical protein